MYKIIYSKATEICNVTKESTEINLTKHLYVILVAIT